MRHPIIRSLLSAGLLAGYTAAAEVVLQDDFASNAPAEAVPAGWNIYKSGPTVGRVAVEERDGKKVVVIDDQCDQSEIGITRAFPAVAGKKYRFAVKAKMLDETRKDAAFFQIRFYPEQKFIQDPVVVFDTKTGNPNVITMQAPEGTERAQVYIYTHKGPKPALVVEEIVIEDADGNFTNASPWDGVGAVIARDSFTDLPADNAVPAGWRRYTQGPNPGPLTVVKDGDGTALCLTDEAEDSEIGIARTFNAIPGVYYRATVQAKAPAGKPGFLIQLSGHPSKLYKQTFFNQSDDFKTYSVTYQMPEDAKNGTVYIYSHKTPKGQVIVKDFLLEKSDVPFTD